MSRAPQRSTPAGLRFKKSVRPWLLILPFLVVSGPTRAVAQTKEGVNLRDALLREADEPGKPAWKPMLRYLAELHGRSVHPPVGHFRFPYEDIGPGYQGGTAFGHIDLTHERLDVVRADPTHVRNQILNELAGQQKNGLIPGVISIDSSGIPHWKNFKGFPPLWVASVDAYLEANRDGDLLAESYDALVRQIGWFERERAAPGGGFFYLDATTGPWESGVDEGVRYDARPAVASACVDASSHVYMMYDHAARWAQSLGKPGEEWGRKAKRLAGLIQEQMWNAEDGFFYDTWIAHKPERGPLTFEGIWPIVAGVATPEQANRVIDDHLLDPTEFLSPHPITTVALSDPKFELRMWRGPAWNCMTYWAARGCLRYGRPEAARRLLEAALDATATQFERTGTIWEFYHPRIGDQESLLRKEKGRRIPCRDYLGHNPLFAMVALWRPSDGTLGR